MENGEFVFSVADNRGNITSETIKKILVEYVKPTCVLNAGAPNAGGEMVFTINGICFSGSFGNAENVVQAYYRYKESGGDYTEWIAAETTAAGGTYGASVSLADLDYTKQYTFQARVADSLASAESVERTVKTIPVFDWGEGGFNFNVPVAIQGTDVMEAIAGRVRQGGGAGQTDDTVFIGWSAAQRLKAQVGAADLGNIVFDDDVCTYGSNSNGQYYKFPDGTLICTKKVSGSFACTNTWGGMYESSEISLGSWAHNFSAAPAVNCSFISTEGTALTEGISGLSLSSAGRTYLIRGTSYTVTGAVHVIAIGRWK